MRIKNDINSTLTMISGLLAHIDPDVQYNEWIRVLMVIFHETDGDEAGFKLADEAGFKLADEAGFKLADYWSSQGYKYKGEKDVRAKWRYFKPHIANPVKMGTLVRMAALHS